MQLFPPTSIKEFYDCEHGEFITLRLGNDKYYSGPCIYDEDEKPHLLILRTNDDNRMHLVIVPSRNAEVLSFGTDWTLSFWGEQVDLIDALGGAGNLIQTERGTFIVGAEMQNGFNSPVVCRLNEPGVWSNLTSVGRGFTHKNWRILYHNENLQQSHELAAHITENDVDI